MLVLGYVGFGFYLYWFCFDSGVDFATAENRPESFSLEEFERLNEDEALELDKRIDQLIEKTSLYLPTNRYTWIK